MIKVLDIRGEVEALISRHPLILVTLINDEFGLYSMVLVIVELHDYFNIMFYCSVQLIAINPIPCTDPDYT